MTSFYPAPGFPKAGLAGSILVLPSVSLGNVPQLAADLLIASLDLKRVGWIGNGDTVAPFVGMGDDGELVTGGLELYGSESRKLYIAQQRSPILKSRKEAHVQLLTEFISSSSFAFVLIVTSLDAANQDDAQLLTPHQRIIPPSTSSAQQTPQIQRLTSLLPPLSLHLEPPPAPHAETDRASHPYPPFLPAAGLTRRLLTSLNALDRPVAHAAVTAWCVEGDNRGDAIALAEIVLQVIDAEAGTQLKEPESWKGLFGTTTGYSGGTGMDAELYG